MTETTPPYRYVDADNFCLSARLLPDLNTGGVTDTLSITIEGSDEPQSVHVPASDVPAVAAGIVAAAGQQPAATVPASAPTDQAGLRDRIRRAVCEAEGFGWDTDMLEPDEYGEVADAVLAVLPASAACSDPIECSHEAALGELAELRARITDYENRITWETTCGSCARILDSSIRETERAERAEAAVARVRRLHDRLATETELASPEDRITRADAAERIAAALDMQSASGPCRAAGEPRRPRCPHCRMPHDLTPSVVLACQSIRASLAEQPAAVSQPGKEANACGPAPDRCDAETGEPCAKHEIEQSHVEGDHSLCRSADCEVLRQS